MCVYVHLHMHTQTHIHIHTFLYVYTPLHFLNLSLEAFLFLIRLADMRVYIHSYFFKKIAFYVVQAIFKFTIVLLQPLK